MKFIQTIASQPASFWLSVIATLISIGSFLIGLKNSRKTQMLDTLQRRNQLLLKISELDSKNSELRIISAKLYTTLGNLRAKVMENEENNPLKPSIAGFEGVQKELEQSISEFEGKIDSLRTTCNKFTSRIDPMQIEELMPEIQHALSLIERSLGGYVATLHVIEAAESAIDDANRLEGEASALDQANHYDAT